jgi:putative ABC transport system permease protein
MLKNYLKIALRNLWQHKSYSFINVTGLAAGMACCLLILLFVRDELAYDRFHVEADRIYQLTYGLQEGSTARTPPPIAPLMKANFPEVEAVARVYGRSASIGVDRAGGAREQFEEERFYFADSTLTQIFTFNFLRGDARTALREPFTVLITEPIAQKYFRGTDPIGKTLLFAGKHPLRVTGVVKPFPPQSHLHFDFLANYETMFATELPEVGENLPRNWIITHSYTYVLLHPGKSPAGVDRQFPEFLKKFGNPVFRSQQTFTLTPLTDLHLRSDITNQPEPTSSTTYLYIFSAVAFVTLLIACINFVNLSTARSLKRAREVGMRKVLGAEKRQLVGQFLGESLLVSLMALVLSVLLMFLFLPEVNRLTQKSLSMAGLTTGLMPLGLVGVFLLVGLLAGLYPAFFVTGFRPVLTLKGLAAGNLGRGVLLRKGLVVVQFTVTIVLVTGSLIAWNQWHYMRSLPLGFQKDHVVMVPLFSENFNSIFGGIDSTLRRRTNTFEEILLTNPNVEATTLSSLVPGAGSIRRGTIPEGFTQEDNLFVSSITVDYDFIPTYKIKLLAGRDFGKQYGTDHLEAFIINEKAVQDFGWKTPEAAIGKGFEREGKKGRVVGVVENFHFESLRDTVNALVLDVWPPMFTVFSVRIANHNVPATIDYVRETWEKVFPEKVFDYSFLDNDLDEQYQSEERLGRLIRNFAGLAILISCLGLYGLILFTVEQKVKEIGIRKVLGASVGSIVALLSKDFLKLVGIAFLLAAPLAWYGARQWLADFATRAEVSWWIFAGAGLLAALIALLTISFQSIKAALANPVKSLRSE